MVGCDQHAANINGISVRQLFGQSGHWLVVQYWNAAGKKLLFSSLMDRALALLNYRRELTTQSDLCLRPFAQ